MQVTETKNEGLSREFAIVVSAADIEQRVSEKINELVDQVRLPGFRPGKVPISLIRKRYGDAVMGEVVQTTVSETTTQTLTERELQPAVQPKIEVTSFEDGKDLEFTLAVDVLPVIDPVDFRTLEFERLKAKIEDKQVDESLDRLAEEYARAEPIAKPRKSKEGDIVVIDFEGSIDGTPFDGGKAEDHQLQLGEGRFIPGFEDQLIGLDAPSETQVEVTFPEEYGNKDLAGKAAVFALSIKEIRERVKADIDDEFAKSLGMESVDALREQVRSSLANEYGSVARDRLKRQLLDRLDELHDFESPPAMVEGELESIWTQFENARKNNELDPEDIDKSDDEMREEYRKIAGRRVRLGLLLAAVGQRNNIEVTPEELNRALIRQAQMFPGQERQIIETYQKNEQLMGSLRAPIFEDKVVDYILEMASVSEREVSVEELHRDPDEEEAKKPKSKSAKGASRAKTAASGGKKPAAKPAAKKPKAAAKKKEK